MADKVKDGSWFKDHERKIAVIERHVDKTTWGIRSSADRSNVWPSRMMSKARVEALGKVVNTLVNAALQEELDEARRVLENEYCRRAKAGAPEDK